MGIRSERSENKFNRGRGDFFWELTLERPLRASAEDYLE
jgi:hypothetical protein